MKKVLGLSVVLAVAPFAQAADIEAGKAKAASVCAACHGANGVSVNDAIPNLAAQRSGYLEAQLKAFKDGTRKAQTATSPTAIMNAIATQLSADDIANVAAYFASQPGAAAGTKSALLPNVAKTQVTFPEGYKESFTKYHTISFPATKQVRYYYANKAAVAAAKAGKPLPDGSVLFAEVYAAKLGADGKPVVGSDGFFVTDKLVAYTAMAREAGWGKDIPEMLRNENWNYAIFTTDKQHRPGVNQAECLGCHKPLDNVSYTFTLKQLAGAK
jgi:cytochrome c553